MRRVVSASFLVVLAVFWTQPAVSETVAEFYKGKQVRIVIGYPAGSGYDVHARLLARHLGRNIPGEPSVIPQNMDGAGSLIAANYVYELAAKDGLTIGAINRSVPLGPLLGTTSQQAAKFDALQYGWIGSINSVVTIGMVWAASGITKFEDLLTREIVVSSDTTSSDSYVFAHMLNNLVGTKLKVITGYAGTNASYLAMERGETTGCMGSTYSSLISSRPELIRDRKVNILIQISLNNDPALPGVPSVLDYVKGTQKQALELILAPQQMGRPYMTSPGVDPARLAALRTAFMATMKDPEFVADAKKLSIDIDPMDGQAVHDLLVKLYKSSPEAVQAAKEALGVNRR
jgi:tripartite-type tricarboxylate transporter receptor subunit TctC